MANLLETKAHINSLQDTAKITKAMQLVSAVKMKQVEARFQDSQSYVTAIRTMLANVVSLEPKLENPLLRANNQGQVLYVVIGTSRGFVGAQLNKLASTIYHHQQKLQLSKADYQIITLKAKTLKALGRLKIESDLHFQDAFEGLDMAELTPLKTQIISGYLDQTYKLIYLAFTQFTSVANQQPIIVPFLPLDLELVNRQELKGTFRFEPNAAKLLHQLLEEYIEVQLRNAVTSATASEYAARMLAMQQATDNSNNLSAELLKQFNKERQTAITAQIQETVNARFTLKPNFSQS